MCIRDRFEAGHGLPASTLSSARLLAARYPHNSLEGQEGDVIEDSEPSAVSYTHLTLPTSDLV